MSSINLKFFRGKIWTSKKHDQEIIVDGTVKEHSTYKGTKQTALNRVKIKELN